VARQHANVQSVPPDPTIAAALAKVKSGKCDFSVFNGYAGYKGDTAVPGCTRDANGALIAGEPAGMSEERADLMWSMHAAFKE
jgi:hypothetical protein